MRVLLLATNRCRIGFPPFPLGLASIVANLDHGRHQVEVWDAMFADDWEASLRACVRAARPDVIGLSVRNVDDQEMRAPQFFLDEVRAMVGVCREESPAPRVAGGAAFGVFPAEVLAYLGVEYGVAGEGEWVFPQVLDRLAAGASPAGLPGVFWHEAGRVHGTPPAWIPSLDALAPPDRRTFDAARYHETPGTNGLPNTATVQSKRGCPLPCIYCSTFAVEGAGLRLRSPRAVVDEIQALHESGLRRVQFVDSIFTNPPDHARAICEGMLRRGVGVQWSALINPAFADPDLLALMRRAGCVLVMVGNESACSHMLGVLRKGFGREEVERCFAACRNAGLRTGAFLLLGGPGEDRDSVRESIDVLQRLQPDRVGVTVGIRIYPGTELARIALAEGQLAPEMDLLTPRFYLAPALRDWIYDALAPVMAQDARWGY